MKTSTGQESVIADLLTHRPGVVHNDSIINREGVGRQTSNVPCSDLDRLTKCLAQTEILRTSGYDAKKLERAETTDPLSVCLSEKSDLSVRQAHCPLFVIYLTMVLQLVTSSQVTTADLR